MTDEITLKLVADVAELKANMGTVQREVHEAKGALARTQWLLVTNLAGLIGLLVAVIAGRIV